MRIGLALAGGGARGAAHVGVLLALEEAGLPPASIAGTSAGGIVAGLYAAGMSAAELNTLVEQLSRHGKRLIDPDCLGLLKAPLELLTRGDIHLAGLLRGDRLERLLRAYTHGKPLCEARMRTVIPAADLCTGRTILFTNSAAGMPSLPAAEWTDAYLFSEAMRASSAFPAVFRPKQLGPWRLIDGGVADNLPVNLLRAANERNVLAVDLSKQYAMPDKDTLVEVASHALSILQDRLKQCTARGELYALRPTLPEDAGLLTFGQMPACVEAGYEATVTALPVLKALFGEEPARRTSRTMR
jgi:NTE family protein